MAIGSGQQGFPFTEHGILYAPNASGVYALYNQQEWIYVGQSNDIQRRLREHLAEWGTCIKERGANSFQFELVDAAYLGQRENAWMAALRPTCNQMWGG